MKLCSVGIKVTGSDGEECLRSLIGLLIAGATRKETAETKHRRAAQDLGEVIFFPRHQKMIQKWKMNQLEGWQCSL